LDKTDSIKTSVNVFALLLTCFDIICDNFFYQTYQKNDLIAQITCQIVKKSKIASQFKKSGIKLAFEKTG